MEAGWKLGELATSKELGMGGWKARIEKITVHKSFGCCERNIICKMNQEKIDFIRNSR